MKQGSRVGAKYKFALYLGQKNPVTSPASRPGQKKIQSRLGRAGPAKNKSSHVSGEAAGRPRGRVWIFFSRAGWLGTCMDFFSQGRPEGRRVWIFFSRGGGDVYVFFAGQDEGAHFVSFIRVFGGKFCIK